MFLCSFCLLDVKADRKGCLIIKGCADLIAYKTMEEELEKEVEETTVPTGSEEEKNEELDNEADEPATQSSDEETNEIDYEALLKAETTRREKAEKKIVDMKRAEKNGDEYEDPDELINQRIDERVSRALQDSSTDTVEDTLSSITDNDKERALIKFHYENSIKQSGYSKAAIAQDLQRAKLIANESKIRKENSELKEALKAKASLGRGSSGTNQDRTVVEDRKFSKQDLAFMQRHGIKPEDVKTN